MAGGPGYDYVPYGTSWVDPRHITYSIAPDGVYWHSGVNGLNASLNALFGTGGAWQYQIARALATWQSVANLNFVPVGDGPYDWNALGRSQGDTRFGDVRFGGYAFTTGTTLAQTSFPPPVGSTQGGDVELNTAMPWKIDGTYDLYSVVLHEIGHSLGLDEAPNPAMVMYPDYGGVRGGLSTGDIAGVQAIYGPRSPDVYQAAGQGTSPSTSVDLTAALGGTGSATLDALSMDTVGDVEYFSFTAPGNLAGPLQVTAAASGLSMLSPQVSILDEGGTVLARAANAAAWSVDVTAGLAALVPGKRYVVAVTGATGDVFSVGSYRLSVSLPVNSPPPPAPVPPASSPAEPLATPVIPTDPYEPNNSPATAIALGRVNVATVAGLGFSSGSDVDYFRFQTGRAGWFTLTARGASLVVMNARGKILGRGTDAVNLSSPRAGTTLLVKLTPSGGRALSDYSFSVAPRATASIRRKPQPARAAVSRAVKAAAMPIARPLARQLPHP